MWLFGTVQSIRVLYMTWVMVVERGPNAGRVHAYDPGTTRFPIRSGPLRGVRRPTVVEADPRSTLSALPRDRRPVPQVRHLTPQSLR
jgi:hypothetical protein